MKKLSVTYFQRKPSAGHWSIEFIFQNLKACLQDRLEIQTKIAKYSSNGFFKRVYIALEAIFYQSDINHVTGDIHYVTTFLKKSKTILTIHDCGILKDSSVIKRNIFKLFWYYIPCKRVKYIVAVSEFSKKEILFYVPSVDPEKIIVIPSAVSDGFKYFPKEFNKKKPAILHIGTAHNKNLLRLIEALKDIPCTLTIIGVLTDEQSQTLKKNSIQWRNLFKITEAEMINEYINTDMLVFVSTLEGFGMPIIEANRTGRAVLTSTTSSMPEVANESACLVNPYDVAAIKTGIIKIINDDNYRQDLIEKGLKNAKRYDNVLIADRYLELYESIKIK